MGIGFPPTGETLKALIDSTPTGSWKKVESWEEFIALEGVTEGPAGVWNFNEPIFSAGLIFADAGASVVGGEQSSIFGIQAVEATWVFNCDGPAISGPLRLQGLSIVQLHPGASAGCISVSSSLGRVAIVITCLLRGGRIGVEITSSASPVVLDLLGIEQCDRGVVIRGAVSDVAVQVVTLFNMTLPGSVGFEVESSAILSSSSTLLFNSCATELAEGTAQYAYAFSHAMVVTSPALIQVSGGGTGGPQGQSVRQTDPGVADMDVNDDRLVIKGDTSQPNWKAVAIGSRDSAADPIVVTVSGQNDDSLIPYNDPLDNTRFAASTDNHFALVLGNASPGTDWHWRYSGALKNVTVDLNVEVLAQRASGAGPSLTRIKWQKNPLGVGVFSDIPDTEMTWSSTNSYTPATGASIATGVNTDDTFRPVLVNLDDAGNIELGVLRTNLEISS